MLKLPNVTLVAMGSTNIYGMVDALEYSSKDIKFGAVKIVSHICPRMRHASGIEFSYTPKIKSIDQWNHDIIYELWRHIDTPYAILIHPDGFIVNPQSWRPEFLEYDYVGAPWPLPTDNYSYRDAAGEIVRVGNSVSLRSKKIMRLPTELELPWREYYGNTNEDGFLCCHNRLELERCGVKFAPIEVAKWFSRETEIPENQDVDEPFAFHRNNGRNAEFPNFELR